jgi:predicted phosphoribosyltransferase
MDKFNDRYQAGQVLANALSAYANRSDVVILALPRGGVPVASEIAKALAVPLDVFIVRKLGVPGHEELAMGAIATGNVTVFNEDVLREIPVSKAAIERVIQAEQQELQRREKTYRGNRPFPILKNKIVILVDDGIATGASMRAAIQAIKQNHPARLIMAVPVAAFATCKAMAALVDELVCPLRPQFFYAVGEWYDEFPQTSDEEVFKLLAETK